MSTSTTSTIRASATAGSSPTRRPTRLGDYGRSRRGATGRTTSSVRRGSRTCRSHPRPGRDGDTRPRVGDALAAGVRRSARHSQGIVAGADLADPRIEETLERHAAFANLRGIRDLRYDDYLRNETWLRGYGLLARFGLVACDDPYVEEMALARALAERYPRDRPLRRPRELSAAARRRVLRGLAARHPGARRRGERGDQDLRPRHGRSRWTVESLRPWVDAASRRSGPSGASSARTGRSTGSTRATATCSTRTPS